MRNKLINISVLCITTLILLAFSEILLRIISTNNYYIWPANLKQYFLPKPSIFPGINDTAFFKVNSFGFRGNEMSNSTAINIIALGGSTTECLYLDQNETWPALLEKYLNQNSSMPFRVFNGGRSGLNSNHHLIQIKKLLQSYNWIDIIIVLDGINDLQYSLSLGDNYRNEDQQSIYDKAFLISPANDALPLYKRSYLYMDLSKIKKAIFSYHLAEDPYGLDYNLWRKNRANAVEIINTMPLLDSSINNFGRNNYAMIKIVKEYKKQIIFLTQPVAWQDSMSSIENKLCWWGWIGKDQYKNSEVYYSFSILKQAMDKYNSQLKNMCAENNIACIDLENMLEKDTTTFYDDCHFNESGARKIAKIVFNFLSSKENVKKYKLDKVIQHH